MILTPRELKHFENFTYEEMVTRKDPSQSYADLPGRYDIVVVKYYKKYKGFFKMKELEWDKTFYFKRSESPSEKEGYTSYKPHDGYPQLRQQLQDILFNDITYISTTDYEFFKSEFPEKFV